MRIYLLFSMMEAFISLMLKEVVDSYTLTVLWMFINSFVLIGWFYHKSKDTTMFMFLLIGFLLRLLMMIYDTNVSRLPFNTGDAYKFDEMARLTAAALPEQLLEHFTGFYSQFLGIVYYIFGEYNFFGHFINISFIMLAATKLIDIADLLEFKTRNEKLLIALWLFMPIPMLMGYALLREASMYYFIVQSIYFFLKWFEKYNYIYAVLAILMGLIGGKYHSGVMVVVVPYIYYFIFYSRKKKKISFNIFNKLLIVSGIVVALLILQNAGDEIYGKATADTGGGSAYLTNIEMDGPVDLMIWGPVKEVFLLFSPMPWLVRGGLDIATLMFDSTIFIFGMYLMVRYFRTLESKVKALVLVLLLGGFVFGLGSLNTGTAMRHRNKFTSLVLVSGIYVIDKNKKVSDNIENFVKNILYKF